MASSNGKLQDLKAAADRYLVDVAPHLMDGATTAQDIHLVQSNIAAQRDTIKTFETLPAFYEFARAFVFENLEMPDEDIDWVLLDEGLANASKED